MTDKDLKQHVQSALDWEPSLDASDIGVSVDEAVVTLRGNVASFAEKVTAERVALRVYGVKAVADDLAVHLLRAFERNDTEIAAKQLGQQVHVRIFDASTDGDIEAAFRDIASSKIEAILIGTDPLFSAKRNLIVALTTHYTIPAIYDSRVQVEEGGLISYGTSYADTYRQAGVYAGRILNGARPADLPVLLPTKFELVINLKTAKNLGLQVPSALLVLADEVIE